jgi:hypothetical protein
MLLIALSFVIALAIDPDEDLLRGLHPGEHLFLLARAFSSSSRRGAHGRRSPQGGELR